MKEKTFRERLRRIINELGVNDSEFAKVGNISKATLSGYFNTERLPKQDTLSLWVNSYGINGNWLLTGKGAIFLDGIQNEMQVGIGEPCPCSFQDSDPVVRRMETASRILNESGASPEVIQQAIMKILDSQNDTHTQTEETFSTPAFANDRDRSIKRT